MQLEDQLPTNEGVSSSRFFNIGKLKGGNILTKRYISYILTVALLLLLGGSVVMACNNCSSLEGTILEIRSQRELAKVLEQVNLSEVQKPSVSLTNLLNEIGVDGNCTAYLLIPAPSKDPCNEPVKWSCLSANCPSECNRCYYYGQARREDFNDCAGLQHICCLTENHACGKDEHGCKICRCT